MRTLLFGLVAATALIGAAPGIASAADYPPCKSRTDDHCIQSGAMMHQGAAPKMGHKAKQMGHKAAAKGKEMKVKMEPAAGKATESGGIPRGCSPATTPCQ